MANWKKIITSGSHADLNEVSASGGFSGSFEGDGAGLTGVTAAEWDGTHSGNATFTGGNLNSSGGTFTVAATGVVDIDATGAITIDSEGGSIGIGAADDDYNINIGTQGERTISIGTGAFADIINIGNTNTTTAVSINAGTGDLALASTSTGDITINSDMHLLLDSDGVLELNSSAGTIGIGTDNDAFAINIGLQGARSINIGTGAFEDVITIGNVTDATAVNLNAGTAGIALASTGAGNITINSDMHLLLDSDGVLELNSSAGTIGIGTDDDAFAINIGLQGARSINIGTGAFEDVITIGNTTDATAVNLNAGTAGIALASTGAGNITINSDMHLYLDSDGVLELNSSAGAIGIGTDNNAFAINIGSQGARSINIGAGAFEDTITIGNTTGATAVNLIAGTGGVRITGDLVVDGTTTTVSSTNLEVTDPFIFLASGSYGSNLDAGIIVQSGSNHDEGSALYHDFSEQRWSVAMGVSKTATGQAQSSKQNVVTGDFSGVTEPDATSGSFGPGEMWVDDSDFIWIRVAD